MLDGTAGHGAGKTVCRSDGCEWSEDFPRARAGSGRWSRRLGPLDHGKGTGEEFDLRIWFGIFFRHGLREDGLEL